MKPQRYLKLHKIITTVMVLCLFTGNSYSQNLSSLLDAIREVEKKLTGLIGEESTARKAADEKIKSSIPKGKPQTITQIKTDTTLKVAIEKISKNIQICQQC